MTTHYSKIGVVLLARLSSTRLPGKALIKIYGKPIIQHIIDRLQNNFEKENIILATSKEKSDDSLCKFAKIYGIPYYRGSLTNVAERFMEASIYAGFDISIRITGDSIFTDTNILNTMFKEARPEDYDMISNRRHKTYPIGQTFEIINMDRYKKLYPSFSAKEDFEHVTQYLYNNEKKAKLNIYHHINPDGIYRNISLAVDTPEDLEKAKEIVSKLGKSLNTTNYKKIYALYEKSI